MATSLKCFCGVSSYTRDGVTSLYKSVCPQPDPCNRPCLDPDDTTVCTPLVCNQPAWAQLNEKLICNQDTVMNYSVQTIKYCYCNQALFTHISREGPFVGWLSLLFTAEPLCQSYVLCVAIYDWLERVMLTTSCLPHVLRYMNEFVFT